MRRALVYVRPYTGRLAVIAALSLASTALSLWLPSLTRTLVDDALVGRNRAALWRVVWLFGIGGALGFVLNVVAGLRYARVSAEILFDMRRALYEHLQRLSPRFYASTRLGDIVSRLNNDIGEIQRVVAETALAWVGNVVFLAGSLAILIWFDWRLTLVGLATLPISAAS
jgi:ATP-binding cassette subfamily B protein